MSTQQDKEADAAIRYMVAAVIGTALAPAHINWALTASAMGAGVVAIGSSYGVTLDRDEAWKLVREFFKAAGFWFLGMQVGSKILAAIMESTGIGYGGGVALDAAVSAGLAYSIGACAKAYFKGERNKEELGRKFRIAFAVGKQKARR